MPYEPMRTVRCSSRPLTALLTLCFIVDCARTVASLPTSRSRLHESSDKVAISIDDNMCVNSWQYRYVDDDVSDNARCDEDDFERNPPIGGSADNVWDVEFCQVRECTRWIYVDLDSQRGGEFQMFKTFLHTLIRSCVRATIGHQFVSTAFDPALNKSSVGLNCCNEVDCEVQLAALNQGQYFHRSLDDRLVVDDDPDFIYQYVKVWYDEVKEMKQACKFNSFILITDRIVDMEVGKNTNLVAKYFQQWFTEHCIQPTIILTDANCLNNVAECIRPCAPSDTSVCMNRTLDNCTFTSTSTTSTTSPSTSSTVTVTTEKPDLTALHVMYLFGLSDKNNVPKQLHNITVNIWESVDEYITADAKTVAVSLFINPEHNPPRWLRSSAEIAAELNKMDASSLNGHVKVPEDTSDISLERLLEVARRFYAKTRGIKTSDKHKLPKGELKPVMIVVTDFYSTKLRDFVNVTKPEFKDVFDLRIHVYNYDAYLLFKGYRFLDISKIHYNDPNKLTVIPLDPSDAPPERPDKPPLTEAELLLLILGTVFLLVICMASGTALYRRRHARTDAVEKFREMHEDAASLEPDVWELSWDRLLIKTDKLGAGAYGQVHRGKVHGRPPSVDRVFPPEVRVQYEDCDVAVKSLPRYASDAARREFMLEIELMKRVAGRNENIVDMLGCITVGKTICLVMEYCPNRDLLHYVKALNSASMEDKFNYTKEFMLFAWQLCDGMQFLSSQGIVHRDLAARNILIDRNKNAKISDFGLCIQLDRPGGALVTRSVSGRLPIKWLALEALQRHEFSTKSDVWSFGILLYEMYSFGQTPFAHVPAKALADHLETGARPDRPELCAEDMFGVMEQCWKTEPDDRPDFAAISMVLTKILERVTEGYGYLDLMAHTVEENKKVSRLNLVKSFRRPDEELRQRARSRFLTRDSTMTNKSSVKAEPSPPTPKSPSTKFLKFFSKAASFDFSADVMPKAEKR